MIFWHIHHLLTLFSALKTMSFPTALQPYPTSLLHLMVYSLSATVYSVTRFVLKMYVYLVVPIICSRLFVGSITLRIKLRLLTVWTPWSCFCLNLWLYLPSFFLYQRSECIDLSVGLVNLRASAFTILSSIFCIVIFPPCLNILPSIVSEDISDYSKIWSNIHSYLSICDQIIFIFQTNTIFLSEILSIVYLDTVY